MPFFPPEHGKGIHDDDAPQSGIAGREQEPGASLRELEQGVLRGRRGGHQIQRELLFDGLEDGREEVALVAELVIKGAGGDARFASNLLG